MAKLLLSDLPLLGIRGRSQVDQRVNRGALVQVLLDLRDFIFVNRHFTGHASIENSLRLACACVFFAEVTTFGSVFSWNSN